MRGINVKRGVESTLERVFNNTGRKFDTLRVSWTGSTAGVNTKRVSGLIDAHVVFPGIDETSEVPSSVFNDLIGYALHELGHVWFTDEDTWNLARDNHGEFVSSLINGLEDPRIERKVIDSGYAPNSRVLFESLVNSILTKDGYVQPDDFKNVPFLLAIEGRRLNGYPLVFDSIVDESPWAADLHWALNQAHRANSTREIVGIAVELNKRLQQQQQQQKQKQQQQQQQEERSDPGNPGKQGEPGEQDDQPGKQGNQPGQQPGQQQGQRPGNRGGKGKSDQPREVEPRSFIKDQLAPHQADSDTGSSPRPSVGKPRITEFIYE